MTDVVLSIQRIKPGKTERLREWAKELEKREDEVVETLQNQKVRTESAFLRRTDDGTVLVYYMEAEDMEAASNAASDSAYEIDREHQAVLSDVVAGTSEIDTEPLFHFTNPDRPRDMDSS